MLAPWLSALVAKAKVAAVVSAAVAAGGIGGTVALSHVAPASHHLADPATSTQPADPEAADAQDPESAQAGDPASSQDGDPGSAQAGDPESGDAGGTGDPEGGQAGDCPDAVAHHGDHVSAVARSAGHGKDARHGQAVADAAHSDCGKPHAGTSGHDPETGDSTRSHGSTHSSGGDHAPATSSAPAGSTTRGHTGKTPAGDGGTTHHDRSSGPTKAGAPDAKPGKDTARH